MKKSKLISILTTAVLTVSLLAGCGSSGGSSTGDKGSAGKNVKITFLNTKGEIATQLEDATKAFTKENPKNDVQKKDKYSEMNSESILFIQIYFDQ